MMKKYYLNDLSEQKLSELSLRKHLLSEDIFKTVKAIGEQVRTEGDKALLAMAEKYDKTKLTSLAVSEDEKKEALNGLDAELKTAIDTAFANISRFHAAQMPESKKTETYPGVWCWQEFRAIEKVGLYVPGGSAPLFSTALMLAVPAMIAGSKEIYICTPPDKNGKVHPAVIYIADKCHVAAICKAGGAGAVFAMAYGTESVKKVDKIFGPGNQFVTAAKMAVSQDTSIDMPAGPSEVLVMADSSSDPEIVASDLLAQAEHGPDSQAVLVCTDDVTAEKITAAVDRQQTVLPRRLIAEKALANSFVMIAPDLKKCMHFVNMYAPEHLIIGVKNWPEFIPLIQHAGSVFLGKNASESFGDYASGTNHTLPTSGFARSLGGVSLMSFGKMLTFQTIDDDALLSLGKDVAVMAAAEGLDAHKNSVDIRMKQCGK